MKKYLFTMVALLGMAVSSQAMSYEQARDQALFLADKMAYELNLTEEQYEACYEVNLDYFMGIKNQHDVLGEYWERRNADLNYILFDWQYRMFLDAAYFYRPLYWGGDCWHFAVYSRYPHRDYFYFGCPHFVVVYRGGHAWHHHGHSWYSGRDWGHHRTEHHINNHRGMRDSFNSGNYGRGGEINHSPSGSHSSSQARSSRSFGEGSGRGQSQSSTRSTVGTRGNPGRSNANSSNRMGSSHTGTFSGNGNSRQFHQGNTSTPSQTNRYNGSAAQRFDGSTRRQMSSSSSSMSRSTGSSMTRSSSPSSSRSFSPSSSSRSSMSSSPSSRSYSSMG